MSSGHILLIEDNPSDIALTQCALERPHITNPLVVAEDGQDALDYLFGAGPYAGRDSLDQLLLTLLDLKLPKVPGLEVLRRLRTHAQTRRMPIVVLTSSNEEQDVAASYDLGINSYIPKPVGFSQFAHAVEQLGLYWPVLNQPPPTAVRSASDG